MDTSSYGAFDDRSKTNCFLIQTMSTLAQAAYYIFHLLHIQARQKRIPGKPYQDERSIQFKGSRSSSLFLISFLFFVDGLRSSHL